VCVTVSQRISSDNSPSAWGSSSKCQWLDIRQVGEQLHARHAAQRLGEDALEGAEVVVIIKERAAADAAVEHVEDHPAWRMSRSAWHAGEISVGLARASKC
jgi:hypothetical protein